MAYLGENIAKLGFGLMRLPEKDKVIDLAQTCEMVDLFLDGGFTYFDTAYGYAEGRSEEAMKAAIVDRHPREKYQLATKLPAWAGPKTADEAKQMFWTSLKRTNAEYFDFYLLHNISETRAGSFDEFGMWDFVQELKQKGLIKNAGFSFHDKAEFLDKVLTEHPEVDFVQLQINYADWETGTVESRKCYETARRHGTPVVIMEPVKGGLLADPATTVKAALDSAGTGASYSSWAIRFAASLEGVITVLSGMSTIEQVRDNVSYMKDFKPLTGSEQEIIKKARAALDAIPNVPCTGCQYCVKDCPKSIVIPKIFDAMNRYLVFDSLADAKMGYSFETRFGGKASDCIKCGKCEDVCPQQLKIRELLEDAAKRLEG